MWAPITYNKLYYIMIQKCCSFEQLKRYTTATKIVWFFSSHCWNFKNYLIFSFRINYKVAFICECSNQSPDGGGKREFRLPGGSLHSCFVCVSFARHAVSDFYLYRNNINTNNINVYIFKIFSTMLSEHCSLRTFKNIIMMNEFPSKCWFMFNWKTMKMQHPQSLTKMPKLLATSRLASVAPTRPILTGSRIIFSRGVS